MILAANNWKKFKIPNDIADKKMAKETLNKLYKNSKTIQTKIKKGAAESELKTDLFALHNTFHTVIGLCNANEDIIEIINQIEL